jgi:WD40 repeat protein/tetratricopeptide (TPR) repeat protein
MSEITITCAPGDKLDPFLGLEQLKEEHLDLLRRSQFGDQDPGFIQEVVSFVRRGYATGVVLDDDAERYEAQSLLTYWCTVLYRADFKPPPGSLQAFNQEQAPTLENVDCPYLEIAVLQDESAGQFFGWQRLIKEGLGKLQEHRFLAVVGANGSGRTSFVLGGLLPALKKRDLPGTDAWRYPPPLSLSTNPLVDLANFLGQYLECPAGWAEQQVILFRQEPTHLVRLLDEAGKAPVVLVVDDFEKIFAQEDKTDSQAFINNLLALVQESETRHQLIVIVRVDALTYVAPQEALRSLFQKGELFLVFTTRELRQAIEEPAKRVGLKFAEGLVDRILLDIQGDPAALTLLQFTMVQLWKHRQGNRITRAIYEEFGGGRRAVGQAAETLYQEFVKEGKEDQAQTILMAMAQPGVGYEVTRLSVSRCSLYEKGGDSERVDSILDSLVDARLVRQVKGATRAEDTFTLAHEALLVQWPRFLDWMARLRDEQRFGLRLRATAEQWRDANRDVGALYLGRALEDAEAYASNYPLDGLSAEFLKESKAAERRQRQLRRGVIVIGAVALGAIVTLVIAMLYLRASKAEELKELQKLKADSEEKSRRELGLQVSFMSAEEGVRRQDIRRQDTRDIAGSYLWFTDALSLLLQHRDDSPSFKTLEDSYRLRMGLTWRRLPKIEQMLFLKDLRLSSFSADGRFAVLVANVNGANDRHASVWDLQTGKQILEKPLEHPGPIQSVCFSPDSDSIVITCDGRNAVSAEAHVWRTSTGQHVQQFLQHKGKIVLAAFSRNNSRQVATLSKYPEENATEAFIWGVKDGRLVAQFPKFKGGVVNHAAFSPNGHWLVAGVEDLMTHAGKTLIWSVEEPNKMPASLEHVAGVNYLDFSPDREGKYLVTASGTVGQPSGEARVWRMPEVQPNPSTQPDQSALPNPSTPPIPPPTPFTVSLHHFGAVKHAAFSADNRRLVTSGCDDAARVWSLEPSASAPTVGRLLHALQHSGWVFAATFSPDGRTVATASRDQLARVWEVDSGELVVPPINHPGTVNNALFTPDGQRLLTSSEHSVRVWNLANRELPSRLFKTAGTVQTVGFSADARHFVVTASVGNGSDSEVRVWDTSKGAPVSAVLPHRGRVRDAVLHPQDARRILILSADNRVTSWNWASGELKSLDPGPGVTVNCAAWSPDGKVFITTAGERCKEQGAFAQLWDANTSQPIGKLMQHGAAVSYATFSPDSAWVVTMTGEEGGQLGQVELWDAHTGQHRYSLEGHTEAVTYAAFNRDGSRLVTASHDDSARIWEVATGKQIGQEMRHSADVIFAAFSLHGDRVVTCGMDQKVNVWDADTGVARLPAPLVHGRVPTRAAFSPDGRYVVTAAQDGLVRLWELQGGRLVGTQHHRGRLTDVAFTADGNEILSISHIDPPANPVLPAGTARRSASALSGMVELDRWKLVPETGAVPDLIACAHVIGSRTIVEKNSRNLVLLKADKLHDEWMSIQEVYQKKASASAEPGLDERLAERYETSEHWESAIWHLERLLNAAPPRLTNVERRDLLVRKADAFGQLEQWDRAIEPFTEALRLTPSAVAPRKGLARAYGKLGRWRDAVDEYAKAVGLETKDWALWADKGAAHLELSKVNTLAGEKIKASEAKIKALEAYKEAIALKPDDVGLRLSRGDIHSSLQKWPEAKEDYNVAIKFQPANAELLEKRAVALAECRELAQAIADRVAAAEARTKEPAWQKAEDNYTKALGLTHLHGLPAAEVVRIYADRGHVRMLNNKLSGALEDYDQALTKVPNDLRALQGRAEVCVKSNYLEKAAADYAQAVKLDSPNWQLRLSLANCYMNMGKRDQAIRTLDEATVSNQQPGSFWEQRASAYFRFSEWNKAIADYERALATLPANYWIHTNVAQAHMRLREYDKAITALTEVLGKQPNNTWLLINRAEANAGEGWLMGRRAEATSSNAFLAKAKEDLATSIKLFPKNFGASHDSAILALLEKNAAEYHRICTTLLQQLTPSAPPPTVNSIVWTCVLGVDRELDPAELIEFSRRSLVLDAKNHYYLNTLAAAYYRAGEFTKCIETLEEAAKAARGKTMPPLGTFEEERVATADRLFLAMAHSRLGHAQEAARLRDEAMGWIDANCRAMTDRPDRTPLSVWQMLELEILGREVEEVVKR